MCRCTSNGIPVFVQMIVLQSLRRDVKFYQQYIGLEKYWKLCKV